MTNDSSKDSSVGFLSSYARRPAITLFLTPLLIAAVTAALLAVSLVIKPELNISFDQLNYLSIAKNMADGIGARDMGDPPGSFTSFRIGYTLFLAAMIRIFGLSEWLVVAVNCVIFFIFVTSAYLLGLRLFGWLGGTLGALSLITIPEVITFGARNLDAFWPVLIIASILLLLWQPKGARYDVAYGLSAGLAAGYAVFTKETSLLFLPAPAIMLLLGVKPLNAGRILWFYVGVAAMAAFWIGYALFFLKLPAKLLWIGIPPSDLPQIGNTWGYASALAGGLADYFHNPSGRRGSFVFTRLPLAGAMILAFGWSLWSAVKGDLAHRVLLVVFALFLPLSAMAGALDMRFSQNFILLGVFCLLLGAAFAAMAQAIDNRFPSFLKKGHIAIGALIVGAGALFSLLDKNTITLAGEHLALSAKGPGFEIVYSGHKNVRALNGLPEGVVIAGDFFGELNRSVFLFGKGRVSTPLPIRKYDPGAPVPAGVVAVVTRVFKDPAKRDDTIFLFDADAFNKTLMDSKARYVAVPGAMAAVAVWIEDNVGVEKTLTFPRRNEPPDILIILPENRKPSAPQIEARKIYISRATVDMLLRLKTESPASHNSLLDLLFRRGLRLEDEAVSEILEGKAQGLRHVMTLPQAF
jgi:hypothetical protein